MYNTDRLCCHNLHSILRSPNLCFNCLLVTLLVREEFPPQGFGNSQTHNTRHRTDDINSSLLATYTHSLSGRRVPHREGTATRKSHSGTEGTTRGCGREFCSTKRMRCPLVPVKNLISCLNNSTSWQGTETNYSGISTDCAWSLQHGELEVQLEELIYGKSRDRDIQIGHCRPSHFSQVINMTVKATHNIETLYQALYYDFPYDF